jgi:cytochrome c556
MMIRTILITATIAIGLTGVVAQTDPITVRKDLMKQNNKYAKALNGMLKGENPHDASVANAAFNQWGETAAQLGKLFPDNAKEGGNTRAKAAIWENRKDFDTKIAAFSKAVADGKAKAGSLDGVKAAMPAVNDACNNCHELYRAPQKK